MITLNNNYTRDQYYLYWIHKEEHSDIFTQGYVGVTNNPIKRSYCHNSLLKRNSKSYSQRFKNAYQSNLIMDVINTGSLDDVLTLESNYRPTKMIGYNVVEGGANNDLSYRYKHGGTTEYLRFKNLLLKCEKEKLYIDPIFYIEEKAFKFFIQNRVENINGPSFYYELIDKSKGLVPNNYQRILRTKNSDHDNFVKYKNKYISKKEAYKLSPINRITIKKRLSSYNWSSEQAFGFEDPPCKNYEN